MDSVSRQITFAFGKLTSTVDDSTEIWQLWLKIEATFSVFVGPEIVYSEPYFPVVEFAQTAERWLDSCRSHLVYVSLESEERPLIAFYRCADGNFTFYSPHASVAQVVIVSPDALEFGLRAFILSLRRAVMSELHLNIDAALQ
jgi:hypothetical protein